MPAQPSSSVFRSLPSAPWRLRHVAYLYSSFLDWPLLESDAVKQHSFVHARRAPRVVWTSARILLNGLLRRDVDRRDIDPYSDSVPEQKTKANKTQVAHTHIGTGNVLAENTVVLYYSGTLLTSPIAAHPALPAPPQPCATPVHHRDAFPRPPHCHPLPPPCPPDRC